jgi:hypothetical protein
MSADKKKDIDWDEVVKKEARGINDADFGEVQLSMEKLTPIFVSILVFEAIAVAKRNRWSRFFSIDLCVCIKNLHWLY